jgi:type I restriction enzyme S subunit
MGLKPGYKQTEVGVIPEEWDVQSLEGINDAKQPICYGIVQVGSFTRDGISVLAIKNLNTDYFTNVHRCSAEIETPYARSRVRPGDVLISVKGTTGRVGIVPQHFDGNISRDLARLRLADENVPEFWFQMLQSETAQRKLDVATVGTTRMELSIGILKQVSMPRPPKKEQRAIAAALSDVDALISAEEKLIAKKRDLKQAAMQQLLTGKQRLSGFRAAGEYKHTDVGTIPSDWNCFKIPLVTRRNASSIKIGPFGSQLKKESLSKTGYKIYGQENVFDSDVTTGDRFISEEHFRTLKSCEICPGDFLISMMGTVGKCMIVPEGIQVGIMDSHLLRLRFDTSMVNLELLLQLFKSKIIFDQVKQLSVGGIMEGLSSQIIRQIALPLGGVKEQTAIAAVLCDMDAEIAALEQKRDKTRLLKQGMMQELLTGKTRLVA